MAGTLSGCGVGDADLGVAGLKTDADSGVFGSSCNLLLSGDEPPARNMSLKATPDPPDLPNALGVPLNALKALLDGVFEALGVALGLADGVDGEPNAGCANADEGLGGVPMTLVWPNTEPGVAGTGTFGAEDGSPNALTVWDTGFGFANGESLALKFDSPKPVLILRPMNALAAGGVPTGVVLASGPGGFAESAEVCGEVVGVELGAGVGVVEGGVDDVAVANEEGDFSFSGEVAAPRGGAAGVVVAVTSVEANIDFTGVLAGGANGVSPKTVVPVPLLNVASPPVFHAGTASGLLDAAWPNADIPLEANALNAPPGLVAGAEVFVSAGFPNVAGPPDANAPNAPPLPNVEEDVGLIGVAIGVVDIGVPRPVLPNPDWPNAA